MCDLGHIDSYELGESIHTNDREADESREAGNTDWDWALVKIPLMFYINNIVNTADKSFRIEGSFQKNEFHGGAVLVCSGNSGTQQGIMYYHSTAMLMGNKVFEVKEIRLEHALGTSNLYTWFDLMLIS